MTNNTDQQKELKALIDEILSQKFNIIHSRVDGAVNNIIAQMEEIKDLNELSTFDIPEDFVKKLAPPPAPPAPPKDDKISFIHKYVKNISSAANQLNLINNFLEGINQFCTRAALFLLREDKLVGWKGRGFSAHGGGIGDEEVKKIFFSLSANTIFKNVLEKHTPYSGSPSSQPDDHLIYSRFGGDVPEKILVLPFFVKGKPQAIVYTDTFAGKPIGEKEIETISLVGEMSLDLLPLRQKILSRVKTREFVEDADEKPQPQEPHVAPVTPEAAPVPEPQVPPPPPAPSDSGSQTASGQYESYPTSLESLHDEKTVPSIRENDPERLARVIINDIILYNKTVVEDGLKHRNLFSVLQDTILQARELYLNKFSDLGAFEKQLIETLAKGDKDALKGYKFETL